MTRLCSAIGMEVEIPQQELEKALARGIATDSPAFFDSENPFSLAKAGRVKRLAKKIAQNIQSRNYFFYLFTWLFL